MTRGGIPIWRLELECIRQSDNQASYTTHTMMATQETAEYYWQRYCYTKDLTGCATMLMTY